MSAEKHDNIVAISGWASGQLSQQKTTGLNSLQEALWKTKQSKWTNKQKTTCPFLPHTPVKVQKPYITFISHKEAKVVKIDKMFTEWLNLGISKSGVS